LPSCFSIADVTASNDFCVRMFTCVEELWEVLRFEETSSARETRAAAEHAARVTQTAVINGRVILMANLRRGV
jgi:predicted metalloenzyme YecM